jgi:metal transporter CNNM
MLIFLLLQLTYGNSEGGAINSALPIEEWIIFSVASLLIVCFAGMMSGLTVGMMSLDELDLEIKLNSGTDQEKAYAKKVIPVVSRHHFLLVTLLVANAAAMETLPLLLDEMFSEYIAIVMSVTFVLGFGEVIPQALCTGPNQLKIASNLVPIVKIVMFIFSPISWPIAKLLDWILGVEHGKKFGNEDLKALVSLHEVQDAQNKSGLGIGQVNIIHGAIDLHKAVVKSHMIPIEKVYMLRSDVIINKETLTEILTKGYSRVPIHNGDNKANIAGILHIKKLVAIKEGTALSSPRIKLRSPVYAHPNISVLDLLSIFQEGKGHMALVSEQPEGAAPGKYPILGIITLEDVMELLLKTEIMDEDDYDKSNRKGSFENRLTRVNAIKTVSVLRTPSNTEGSYNELK